MCNLKCTIKDAGSPTFRIFGHWLSEVNGREINFETNLVVIHNTLNTEPNNSRNLSNADF